VSVLQTLKSLVALQSVDVRIRDLEKDRRQIPTRLNEIDDILKKLKSELSLQLNALDESEMARRLAEGDLKAEKEKVKKWESRLNELKSNRDYQALSREIESAKKANLGIEDEILRKMQEIEDLKKSSEEKQEELAKLDSVLSVERADLEGKLASINARLDAEEALRNQAKVGVEPSWFSQYEVIRKRRDNVAVVPVFNEHCMGCHMGIPPQLYNLVLRGEEIKTCPNCARILYYEQALKDPADNPTEPAATASES
jgi:uncharacterized protein